MAKDEIVLQKISPTLTRVYVREELFGVCLPVGVIACEGCNDEHILYIRGAHMKDLIPKLEDIVGEPYRKRRGNFGVKLTAFAGHEMLYSNIPIK